MQALQAATSGKQADLLVLYANPLDDIRNTRKIHAFWLRGVPLEGTRCAVGGAATCAVFLARSGPMPARSRTMALP